MMSAADCPRCNFSICFCRWRRLCSPEVPPAGSGVEYVFIPDDDEVRRSPAFSVVVGVVSQFDGDSSLRLHRFRVARSGRVLGRSGDALEVWADDVDCKPKNTWSHIRASNATRSPDGRSLSLCLFSRDLDLSDLTKVECPRPWQLHMNLAAANDDDDPTITGSPMPGLTLDPLMPTCPISAAGELWAPYLTKLDGPSSLVMQRLDKDAGRWVEVAHLRLTHGREGYHWRETSIRAFQVFAVVGSTILLSLHPYHLFFTFDCSTHAWAPVITSKDQRSHYIPLQERSVYVEEDDTIYFLCGGRVYAYKLRWDEDRHHQHRMAPLAMVGSVCPFVREGNGFLAHLGGRIMCSVWIGEKLSCNCDAKLVLITTFRVIGDDGLEEFTPKKIGFLQSTCRRLDLWPSGHNHDGSYFEFRFLQEYEEFNCEDVKAAIEKNTENAMSASMHVEAMTISDSSNVVESTKMLPCCRQYMDGSPFLCAVMLERSDNVRTRKALYIICQVASYSVVYKMKILNGSLKSCHDNILVPHCIMGNMYDHEADLTNQPLPWHFVCGSEYIYGVPRKGNEISACSLHQGTLYRFPARRPIGDEFSIALVLRVGHKTIAIGNALQCVYHLSQANEWTQLSTYGLPDLERKVNLSGYVVLSNESFMVSDADTSRCFLLNLQLKRWSIVMPFFEFTRSLNDGRDLPTCWAGMAFLSERAVFVNGFIYTCSHQGLAAYELVEQDHSYYYLGDRIDLDFPWRRYWERHRMCLDYVGQDTQSGTIMFSVLQAMLGDCVCRPGDSDNYHPICFTVVQVKTEGMHNGKLKPKTIGHVDIGRSFIEWDVDRT